MTNKFYPDTKSEVNFAQIEEKILAFWQKDNTFKKSIEKNKAEEFVFYDGPPFANGMPHYGHLLTGFAKDAIARFQTMLGKRVERKFGWDCHGLPAEMHAEKELGISGRLQIQEFGIDKFNQTCRSSVMKFAHRWEEYISKQGRWVDFKNSYKTMHLNFMESVIWAFSSLYKKGLIYNSVKVVPYSWACQTPLSNFETRMDNAYRQKASKSVIVKFRLKDDIFGDGKKCYLLAWTTTPWTLPSNMLLAVNSQLNYRVVKKDGCNYIGADFFFKEEAGDAFDIKKILGANYEPIFDYFKDAKNAFFITEADFVQEAEGTGVVHIAPGFGEDDFELAKKHNTQVVCPVDASGKFTGQVKDFAGKNVLDANDDVIKALKANGAWVQTDQYLHNYPHCWRTDTPLIYKAVPSWYVKVSAIKNRMAQLNQQINWVPVYVKNGLFGNWLDNAKDWAISRNRFWGTPIPVWQSDDPRYPRTDVYGSIAELEKDFGVKINDLHRPYIDTLTRKNPDDPTGKSMMVRVSDVFDCWFESGSMPFGQCHYPFENKQWFESNFPSDFITEYIAQTRGWFYTLMVLSTALFDKPPFKNCICHGVILDTKGQKLSKRLNNYADPLDVFKKHGSDALRFLMLSSCVMTGGNLLIDKDCNMVKDILRLVIKPIWSAYHFFTTYANFHGIEAKAKFGAQNLMDIYISCKCSQSVSEIKRYLQNYDTPSACKVITEFLDTLNNWYIRRIRQRFVQGDQDAFNTLYAVFLTALPAFAPILPFITEEIWLGLTRDEKSLHLQDFPLNLYKVDSKLIYDMELVRQICNAGLSVRNKKNIRIRQPLKRLYIRADNAEGLSQFLDIIKDELNIKDIALNDINFKPELGLKLKFGVFGKRRPSMTKQITFALKQGKWQIKNNEVFVDNVKIQPDEYEFFVKSDSDNMQCTPDGSIAVMLDTDLDQDLVLEGIARDAIRLIQQARKDAGLKISDSVNLKISTSSPQHQLAIKKWQSDILKSTYCSDLIFSDDFSDCCFVTKTDANLTLGIIKLA